MPNSRKNSNPPEQHEIELRVSQPGLKQAIIVELRRRAKWKGRRGKPYRDLLLAMVTDEKIQ